MTGRCPATDPESDVGDRGKNIEPARFLGRESWSGTVEPGSVADLVILDADPLIEIRNTTRIHAVVARGRHIGPQERADLMSEVEELSAS